MCRISETEFVKTYHWLLLIYFSKYEIDYREILYSIRKSFIKWCLLQYEVFLYIILKWNLKHEMDARIWATCVIGELLRCSALHCYLVLYSILGFSSCELFHFYFIHLNAHFVFLSLNFYRVLFCIGGRFWFAVLLLFLICVQSKSHPNNFVSEYLHLLISFMH